MASNTPAALKPAGLKKVSVSEEGRSRLNWADLPLGGAVATGVIGGVIGGVIPAALISPWIALGLILSMFVAGAVVFSATPAPGAAFDVAGTGAEPETTTRAVLCSEGQV